MIFVTVGTELPFNRLIRTVDEWAEKKGEKEVFAQIGEGGEAPKYIPFAHFLEPADFKKKFMEASVIVAHAGMGSILSALHYGKPIIVMPRRASLGEQRNEHQIATANHLLKLGKISVSFEESDLIDQLDELDSLAAKEPIGQFASPRLLEGLQSFLKDC